MLSCFRSLINQWIVCRRRRPLVLYIRMQYVVALHCSRKTQKKNKFTHREREMNISLSSLLIIIAVFAILGASHGGPLRQDYYRDSCPYVEDIVREVTWKHVAQDLTVAAPLLRLHFHDCFVRVISHVFLYI